MTATGLADGDIPAYWRALGLPGRHPHPLPPAADAQEVWAYFDEGERNYGLAWPVHYRGERAGGLELLAVRGPGDPVVGLPHKRGWRSGSTTGAPTSRSGCPRRCTRRRSTRRTGWVTMSGRPSRAGRGCSRCTCRWECSGSTPCSSRPGLCSRTPGCRSCCTPTRRRSRGSSSAPIRSARCCAGTRGWSLVIAHLGMSEYHEFADLAGELAGLHLDKTMAGTDYSADRSSAEGLPAPAGRPRRQGRPGLRLPQHPLPLRHQREALDWLGLGDDWLGAVLWGNGSRLLGLSRRPLGNRRLFRPTLPNLCQTLPKR